jgi:hypothetical protein
MQAQILLWCLREVRKHTRQWHDEKRLDKSSVGTFQELSTLSEGFQFIPGTSIAVVGGATTVSSTSK